MIALRGSLRRRLLVTIACAVGPVVAGLAGILYFAVQRSIWTRFDAELVELEGTMAELVEYDHEDGYELELGPRPRPLTHAEGAATHLQLRGPEGELISRSRELDEALPELERRLGDARLADGARVRVATLRFVPRVDADAPGEVQAPGPVTLVLARETAATEAMLARLAAWFVGLAGVTLGLAAFAAWWAVRRGLAPLAEVREAIEAIDDRALANRLDERALPAELRPTVARINALLARLEQAFERERRFTADVAHELRTPLSVLRTELELSLKRERSPAEYRESQRAALAGVEQLATLVDDLLTLVRLEHGPPPLEPSRFSLAELVDECWAPQAEFAAARKLELRSELDGAIELESDRDKLRVVISNLLANAAAYTEAGGWIRLESAPRRGLILAVVDSGPPIPERHRERLFERFWRADEARADGGEHCGVGLALALALAEHLGYSLRVEVDGETTGFLIESTEAAHA